MNITVKIRNDAFDANNIDQEQKEKYLEHVQNVLQHAIRLHPVIVKTVDETFRESVVVAFEETPQNAYTALRIEKLIINVECELWKNFISYQ